MTHPKKIKIIRTSTVPISLKILLKGQLQLLSHYFEVIGISSPGKELNDVIIQERVKTYAVNMERKISPFKDILSLVKMIIQLIKLKPVIVHSITPKAGLITMVAAKIVGVPIRIHTFTGLVFPTATGIKKEILKSVDRILCYCATDIIPEGNGVKNDLIENKITNKTMEVLGNGNVNGIDLNYYAPNAVLISEAAKLKTKFLINKDDFVFLFIGRLVKDKGIVELLDAFEFISKIHINAHLIIAGDFEKYFKDFNNEIEIRLNNLQNIHWLGYVDDIRPLLCAGNVLVLPSYREGFPNVPMQAGAFGLPCIVTDINGSNEIIIDGINGIIVPAKNATELGKAMEKIISDNELYDLLKNNAREYIKNRYDQNLLWECLLEKYYELLVKIK